MYNHNQLPEQRRLSALYQTRERLFAHKFQQQQTDFSFIEITPPKPYSYDKYDMIIHTGNTNWLVEIKSRSCTSTQYKELLIEIRKYNDVLDAAYMKGHIPYYFNFFFKDGKVAVWNLETAKKRTANHLREDRKMIHSKTKTDEPCFLLSMASATVYDFPMNIKYYDDWAKRICEERFPCNDFDLKLR
jgi:hypothetical protein